MKRARCGNDFDIGSRLCAGAALGVPVLPALPTRGTLLMLQVGRRGQPAGVQAGALAERRGPEGWGLDPLWRRPQVRASLAGRALRCAPSLALPACCPLHCRCCCSFAHVLRVAPPLRSALPCRLCLGWLLAMVEMKMLLAVVFRGHSLTVLNPDSPWALFPLARPKDGMPARFEAVQQQQ